MRLVQQDWICRLCRRELTALADGELSARRERWVRAHCERCAQCRRYCAEMVGSVATQRSLFGALATAPVDPDALLKGVRARIDDPITAAPRPAARLWIPVAAAAMIALALAVTRFGAGDEPMPARPEREPMIARAQSRDSAEMTDAALPRPVAPPARGRAETAFVAETRPPEPIQEMPDLFRDYRFFERFEAFVHFDSVRGSVDERSSREVRG